MCVMLGTRSRDRDIPAAGAERSYKEEGEGLGFLVCISSPLRVSLLSACKTGGPLGRCSSGTGYMDEDGSGYCHRDFDPNWRTPLSSQSRLEHPPVSSGCCSQDGGKFSFWRCDALRATLRVMAGQNLYFLRGRTG